jgi:hypothetical protein
MINTKLQNIIDTKSAIGNAIVNKGGTITSETPFFNYAAQIDGISTGGGAYSTFVAQAQDNSKYTVYNGYDSQSNPTPNLSNNFAFNRWLLNNSATGDVVLSNVVVAVGGIFNGPNATANIFNLAFINSTDQLAQDIFAMTLNNNFIYVGLATNTPIRRYFENNLVFDSSTLAGYGGAIFALTTNNGFIYAGGRNDSTPGNCTIRKYNELNLALVGNTASYGDTIITLTTNDGFIYAGGLNNRTVQKFGEGNLVRVATSANYGGNIRTLTTNNGFIYVGGDVQIGGGNRGVRKLYESNLVQDSLTVNYGGDITSITTNNGFLYVGGQTNLTVQKFHESNLAFVGNTANYGATIQSITINNGFIYVGGDPSLAGTNRGVSKYYESNLALVGNTVNYGGTIRTLNTNDGFIYAGGATNRRVQRFQEQQFTPDNKTFFNITQIKE